MRGEGGVWPGAVQCVRVGAKAGDDARSAFPPSSWGSESDRKRATTLEPLTFLILSSSSESMLVSYFDGRFLVRVGREDIVSAVGGQ